MKVLAWAAGWLQRARHARQHRRLSAHAIPAALWQSTLALYPFLPHHPRLPELAALFLADKEFTAAAELELSDHMAVAVAAQAALMLLGWSLRDEAHAPLTRYNCLQQFSGFVGIVLYPGEVLARRQSTDAAGVVHSWQEPIRGEAHQRGPVVLNWADVQDAAATRASGYNLVIHELAHVLDMQDGPPSGTPPADWVSPAQWQSTMQAQWQLLQERLSMAERFGAEPVQLDDYAAQSPEEFFAVTTEAYFVNPALLGQELPAVLPLYDQLYQAWRWRGPATSNFASNL